MTTSDRGLEQHLLLRIQLLSPGTTSAMESHNGAPPRLGCAPARFRTDPEYERGLRVALRRYVVRLLRRPKYRPGT